MYPNRPANIPGPIRWYHPFDMAMAAAVDGPPMLAFDAMIASCNETFNNFAPNKTTSIFIRTIIKQNTSSSGAVFMISGMLAGTPITTKKI